MVAGHWGLGVCKRLLHRPGSGVVYHGTPETCPRRGQLDTDSFSVIRTSGVLGIPESPNQGRVMKHITNVCAVRKVWSPRCNEAAKELQ